MTNETVNFNNAKIRRLNRFITFSNFLLIYNPLSIILSIPFCILYIIETLAGNSIDINLFLITLTAIYSAQNAYILSLSHSMNDLITIANDSFDTKDYSKFIGGLKFIERYRALSLIITITTFSFIVVTQILSIITPTDTISGINMSIVSLITICINTIFVGCDCVNTYDVNESIKTLKACQKEIK